MYQTHQVHSPQCLQVNGIVLICSIFVVQSNHLLGVEEEEEVVLRRLECLSNP